MLSLIFFFPMSDKLHVLYNKKISKSKYIDRIQDIDRKLNKEKTLQITIFMFKRVLDEVKKGTYLVLPLFSINDNINTIK